MWRAEHEENLFEIIEDEYVGFYIWRYIGKGPNTSHDYLQDTLKMAMEFAYEEWSVPLNSWYKTPEDTRPTYEQG